MLILMDNCNENFVSVAVREPQELSSGLFWVKGDNDILFFDIPCDLDGVPLYGIGAHNYVSKSGRSFNHERLWAELGKNDTEGHSYSYYPRGRVEINGGNALIFLNPNIHTENIVNTIVRMFGLNKANGISRVRVIDDGSVHYQCYLDDENIE
jgi:hypothetical protein